MFEIFDTDNDGYFSISDLITVLRSFENSRIVPKLDKIVSSYDREHNSSDSSSVRTEADSDGSPTSALSVGSSDSIPSYEISNPTFYTSSELKRVANKMLKEAGFDKKSYLNLSEFGELMNYNIYFKKAIVGAMRPEFWAENEVTTSPLLVGSRSSQRPTRINLTTKSFIECASESGTGFFSSMISPLKTGILKKKGRKSGGMKKRHYIIKGNLMYYYVKKGDSTPKGIMYLPNKLFKKDTINGKHCIRVYSYDSSFEHKVFYANFKEECDEWYLAMLRAANNCDLTEDYQMRETLGVGKFSTVRKAYHKADKTKTVAIKIVSKKNMTDYEREYIMNEVGILRVINHPNVPKVYGVHETHEKLFIVMEDIHGGELFDYFVESSKLEFAEATEITYRLIKIIKYLKELKVMHRDIKTENILISKNGKGLLQNIYLIDFGLAKFVDSREEVTNKLGTLGYCAPEVILKQPYNEQVDVWGVGMVYYLLLTGKLPFDHKSNSQIIEKTVKDPLPLNLDIFNGLDSTVSKFLDRACQKNPSDRLTIEESLKMFASLRV